MSEARLMRGLPAALGSAAGMVLAVLCAVVLTGGAVFFLWQRQQFVQLGYEVNTLRAQRARLQEAIEPLEVEVHYLSRLERIDKLARDELHMRPPYPAQVMVLESDEPLAEPSR